MHVIGQQKSVWIPLLLCWNKSCFLHLPVHCENMLTDSNPFASRSLPLHFNSEEWRVDINIHANTVILLLLTFKRTLGLLA